MIPGLRPAKLGAIFGAHDGHDLVRFVLLRVLGLVLFAAFLSTAVQLSGLIGSHGLLPASHYLTVVHKNLGSDAYRAVPTLFWLDVSDTTLLTAAWLGVVLSAAVMFGLTNAVAQLALWALYMSFVHVGQVFYGYGWEIQILETTFLSAFLCPLRTISPFVKTPTPFLVVLLYRWLIFRIMLGSGLIKLRGDPCWRALTCLDHHYETQPIPNPLSWLINQAPPWFHRVGVLFNHLVEVVLPWFAFGPRRARRVAGVFFVVFQMLLILSGNLSFLNWLTLVPAIACFDDELLRRWLPKRWVERLTEGVAAELSVAHRGVVIGAFVLLAFLSIEPAQNLLSSRQAMNKSFEPFALVNTYGAFGSVGDTRHEVIIEGTNDASINDQTTWKEYELPCKPGDVMRRPCIVSPYHERLDWQMWFAALSSYDREPWIVKLVNELLSNNPEVLSLFAVNPFPDAPPRVIRVAYYRYEMTRFGDESGAYWQRSFEGVYLVPLSKDDPKTLRFLAARGLK